MFLSGSGKSATHTVVDFSSALEQSGNSWIKSGETVVGAQVAKANTEKSKIVNLSMVWLVFLGLETKRKFK